MPGPSRPEPPSREHELACLRPSGATGLLTRSPARQFRHGTVFFLALVALVNASLMALASPDAATGCSVRNARSGSTYAQVQAAVRASAKHDTLLIRGTCVGNTSIRGKALILKGVPTAGQPAPTLDGGGVGKVLFISSAHVVIRDLTITNGKGTFPQWWGGMYEEYGQLTLRGDTSVTGNRAAGGGGMVIYGGSLNMNGSSSVTSNKGGGILIEPAHLTHVILNDSSSVTGNTGGGISSRGGHLILNDSSSVADNALDSDRWGGGGILMKGGGTIVLNGSSSVIGNSATAPVGGGGIYAQKVTLTLNDSSSVAGNTAPLLGGGIYERGSTLTLNDSSSVTGNTAPLQAAGSMSSEAP